MYFPYFRGKQYELIAVRESAERLAEAGFVPIIEPVKESFRGLQRTLDELRDANAPAVVVLNPNYGHHSPGPQPIQEWFHRALQDHDTIGAGIALTGESSVESVLDLINANDNRVVTLIHAGFSSGRELAEALANCDADLRHVFLEESCGKLYQRHFAGVQRVLLRDGFERRRNADHPPVEFFSDLHATYGVEGMDGFGDFLIVGDDYSETGGPAYAVAIHLTFIDTSRDDEMHIFHFVSERQDTPTDPAGKFAESLAQVVAEIQKPGTQLLKTESVQEFVDLHDRGHYPGLGYVKKLSMKHHIEVMAEYFRDQ